MAELITGYGIERLEQQQQSEEAKTQYLTFLIANKTFAVGILDVNEIIEFSELTTVPMMPKFLRGVINLRGNAVPVVDIAARMSEDQSDINKRSCIVLVEVKTGQDSTQAVGMLVDTVQEIVEIEESHIQPAPDMGDDKHSDFILGMGRVEDHFIVLLDVNEMLSSDQVMQLDALQGMEHMISPSGDDVGTNKNKKKSKKKKSKKTVKTEQQESDTNED